MHQIGLPFLISINLTLTEKHNLWGFGDFFGNSLGFLLNFFRNLFVCQDFGFCQDFGSCQDFVSMEKKKEGGRNFNP